MVKIDNRLDKEVRRIERAISALSKYENALEEAPPGQEDIIIIPILNSSGISIKLSRNQAINGCIINWAMVPKIIEIGCFNISLKFFKLSSKPIQNIRNTNTGITINIEFIL